MVAICRASGDGDVQEVGLALALERSATGKSLPRAKLAFKCYDHESSSS